MAVVQINMGRTNFLKQMSNLGLSLSKRFMCLIVIFYFLITAPLDFQHCSHNARFERHESVKVFYAKVELCVSIHHENTLNNIY